MNSKGMDPAYPSGNEFRLGPVMTRGHAGMTKREIMAMEAMNGLCAHSGDYHCAKDLAIDAVMYADALLVELERTCQKP